MINSRINFSEFCLFESMNRRLKQKIIRSRSLYRHNYYDFRYHLVHKLKIELLFFADINELI